MKTDFLKIFHTVLDDLGLPLEKIIIQVPKNLDHGDFATNYPMINAKKIGKNPMETAEVIVNRIKEINDPLIEKINFVPPGFINIKINKSILANTLPRIIESDHNYGMNKDNNGKKALVEFVSANPTGPLTVGHGRNAVIGDCVSRILEWNGFTVEREYYFNNAGRQMRVLGESVYVRYMEILGNQLAMPDGGYEGEYIKSIAKNIFDEHGAKYENDSNAAIFKDTAELLIFEDIKKTTDKIGLQFDSFFNENTLYENKDIEKIIGELDKKNLIYKKDGAVWFKATEAGRDIDKVLIKSTGEPTYRLPDIAYHKNKYKRKYDLMVDIFGADHMDAYPDVLAAINSLGFNPQKVKVLIYQFVTILKDGTPIKMSTRKANFISLENLIDEVGADVTRFFFIMRSMNSHLNFDLDVAKEQSDINPVFYIQYAHARCCSIIRRFEGKTESIDITVLGLLTNELESQLIGKLIEFPELISKCANTLEPQNIANFLSELSSMLHSYYSKVKVIDSQSEDITLSRIYLINSIRIVLRNGLSLLGISAPDKM